jgi:2-dehydro-3-deoxyphosphogluconate aldolase / (4S)-4-hydroxy-2-oxoglutarate aldolase
MRPKSEVARQIERIGIIPVVRATSPEHAMKAASAVCAGGIPVIELTMTVPGAIDVIRELRRAMPDDVLIGAGTVLDAKTAAKCVAAGAEFIVSPGFNRATVRYAKREGVLVMAGALTPNEVITVWNSGSDYVKIFPCGNVGGPSYIRALKAALPQIPMVPTGGVNAATAAHFLEAGAAALGIGGELVSGDPDAITQKARQLVAIVQAARSAAPALG